jgi:protein TonB
MFSNLIESGSHSADVRRKGKFFLGATAFYALLLAVTGVGSIYAYNAKLDSSPEYELLSIIRFTPAEAAAEPRRREARRPAASDNNARRQQFATRTTISVITPHNTNGVAPENARDIGARTPVRVGLVDSDAPVGGPAGTRFVAGPAGGGGDDDGPTVVEGGPTTPPPPHVVRPTPTPTPARPSGPVRLSSSVLVSKAINKPAPPYPPLAKVAGVQGSVSVQVLIDEQGRVVSAKPANGHPLLVQAAVQAAYTATFTPTLLSGQPIKVTGVITYNFVLNK